MVAETASELKAAVARLRLLWKQATRTLPLISHLLSNGGDIQIVIGKTHGILSIMGRCRQPHRRNLIMKKLPLVTALGLLFCTVVPTGAGAAEQPRVRMQTNMGDIVIELNRDKAPKTVDNFLRYVKEGHYDGTIFHRIIPNFMIQGGGFTQDYKQKPTHEPINNEANNGLHNKRGTIAMARPNAPHSASAQFFINVVDNVMVVGGIYSRLPPRDIRRQTGAGRCPGCFWMPVLAGMTSLCRRESIANVSLSRVDNASTSSAPPSSS